MTHSDLERLAEACERAEQELSVKCLRCCEHPETMGECDECQRREHDACTLSAYAAQIRRHLVEINCNHNWHPTLDGEVCSECGKEI